MITVLYRVGLYASSFFPLYVLLIIGNYNELNSKTKIMDILYFEKTSVSLFCLVILLLIIISIISVILLFKLSLNEKHYFRGVTRTEDNLLNYVVTYLVPLLSSDLTKPNTLIVNAGLFLLLGFIYVKNSLVYLNPLFLFFGYNTFKAENGDVLISNYEIYDFKNREQEKLKSRKISYKIFLVRKE